MANPVGKSYLTLSGLLALTDATRLGKKITPKYFKVSSKDYDLYPGIDLKDLDQVWYQGDISGVIPVSDNSTQFVIDIPPEKAANFGATFGLYLEDGTLFLVAKPPHPFSPLMRQYFTAQLVWSNVNEVLDFKYIPFYETEQDLSLLDATFTLGEQILNLRKDVEDLKKTKERLFENDKRFFADKKLFLEKFAKIEADIRNLQENQLALLASFYNLAYYTLLNAQEIQKLKRRFE